MTPQELKNSILQLAVQGKLVEQRAEEGTAEELYKKIQAEKQKLTAEKKIKKEKPLPEITAEEIPFDIPESWKWVRWGELSESIQYGYNAPAKDIGVLKMVRISDIQDGKVMWENVPFCEIDDDEIETYLLEKNDILFARTGGTVGKSFLVKDVPERAIYAGYLIRTRYSKLLCPEYLKYFMKSELYWKQLKNGTIATAQPNCNGKTLSKMILPLPPVEEQKRIVAKIEELLPQIDRYEKAWSKLEEFNKHFPEDMQKSILQYAVQGKLVEQRAEEGTAEELYKKIQAEKQKLTAEKKIKKEKPLPEITAEEIPFDIPESWKWVRLGEIGFTNIGLTYKPKDVCSENGTIVLRSSNIQNGKLIFNDIVRVSTNIPDNKMCQKDDILICARNGSKRLVGKAAIIDKNGMSFGAFMAVFRSICNHYILYIINSAYFRNTLLKDTGTTTINQITQEMLRTFLVPLPPLEEQKRIVAKIEKLLPLCKKLKK